MSLWEPILCSQVMEFGMGSQSQEIRQNLSKFSQFLEHFSQSKWLGDLIAPEFLEQKNLAVKMLADLQSGTREVQLPGLSMPTYCGQCGQTTTKSKGFCDSCLRCHIGYQANQYPNGCPHGCATQGGQYCNYCGTNSRVPGGYCTNCSHCCHGHYQPCPNGCSNAKTINISSKDATSFYDGLAGGSSGLEKLENLVKMSEALLNAFREDVAARKAAEKAQ